MRIKIFLFVLLMYSSAIGGGWDNSLIGARSAGMGTAFVGLADNATAIYYNAAGLIFANPRAQFIICGKSYYPTHTYINSSGKKITSDISAILVELFTYYHLTDRWTIGFGAFTPYAGGGMKWTEDEIGYALEGYIGTLALSPTVALKLFPDLTIGFNVNYYHIVSSQKIRDPNGNFQISEDFPPGLFKSLDAEEKGHEYAFNGSIFYKPNNTFSAGFCYHGPANAHITGTSTIEANVPGVSTFSGNSYTNFYLPPSYALGISYRIRPKILLAAEYDYLLWSRLTEVEKGIYVSFLNQSFSFHEKMGFNDSYYLKFGAEYLYSDKLTLRVGTSYDNGKISKEAYSVTNIDVTKLNFLAGAGYSLGIFKINLAGFLSIGRAETVPATPYNETYDLDAMGVLASIESNL